MATTRDTGRDLIAHAGPTALCTALGGEALNGSGLADRKMKYQCLPKSGRPSVVGASSLKENVKVAATPTP